MSFAAQDVYQQAGGLGKAVQAVPGEVRPRRRVKILPTISYDLMALIILLLIVFSLFMVFCLLSIASQEEAQMEKLAENLGVKIDLEAVDRFGRNAGGDAPEKPGSAEARSLG
jgi:hypothetical protein